MNPLCTLYSAPFRNHYDSDGDGCKLVLLLDGDGDGDQTLTSYKVASANQKSDVISEICDADTCECDCEWGIRVW